MIDFPIDHIEYTLREIFTEELKTKLVSRVKTIGLWNTYHFSTARLALALAELFMQKLFSFLPDMGEVSPITM